MTRSEKHFEEEGHFTSPARLEPRRVNETMEIWETNYTGKGVSLYFPRWIQPTHMASSSEDSTQGSPSIQNADETTKNPGGRNSNTGHVGSKDLRTALSDINLMTSPLGDK